ncbi:hypothetical protein [Burkholderia ubonensis]|uniref:hypothetical protein n=1 Tax=Burkholderia ubonensis TaxID=101571 RepID=UPI0012F7504D|nr:hypothetical protein [Burkholderia ubonensis]
MRSFLVREKIDGHFIPVPEIENPEIAGDDAYSCVDTAGFFCAKFLVAKASDGGVAEKASAAVTKIRRSSVSRYIFVIAMLLWVGSAAAEIEVKSCDNLFSAKSSHG